MKQDDRFCDETDHRMVGYTHKVSDPAAGGWFGKGISFSAISLQGTRRRQEDYLLCARRKDRTIAVICDGIGGMDNGDVASRTGAELLFADLEKVQIEENMSAFFKQETERLDDAVFGLRYPDGTRMKAGTTVVALLLYGDRLHWFSIGDSRLYLLRGWNLQCLTKAHNYAAVLEDMKQAGAMEEDWYRRESRKGEWLTSYLGMGITEQFDYGAMTFLAEEGDRLLLCSDGLYKALRQEELTQILGARAGIDAISCRLQETIIRKNHPMQDNASWVVIGKEGR